MSSIPPADVAYLSANGTKVANAHKDNPGQWQTWWWICFAGQAAFLAFVFLLTGFWSPAAPARPSAGTRRWCGASSPSCAPVSQARLSLSMCHRPTRHRPGPAASPAQARQQA